MDEDEYEYDDLDLTRPTKPIDWAIVGLDFVRQLADATASTIQAVELLLIGHANHQVERASFMDEARRQIESMTNGE